MIKSFLMLGQSNMAGRGFINEVPPIYNERIQMLRNGRWQMMAEPINYDRPVAGVGLASSFADLLSQKYEEDVIGLIPCAEGGSALDEWAPDQMLFKHAVAQAKFAMQTSTLAGILWHQGESDCTDGHYQYYGSKLTSIMEALRHELNVPEIPILIGGLGDFLGKEGFGKGCSEYEQVNQAIMRFAQEHNNCYFITAKELTSNPDGIHVDAVSQRKFGVRYFEAFFGKKHILEPLVNEDELLNQIYTRKHTKSEQIYMLSVNFGVGNITYKEFAAKMLQINGA